MHRDLRRLIGLAGPRNLRRLWRPRFSGP